MDARTAALPGLLPLASGEHAIDVSTWGTLEWTGYGSMILACVWVLWRAVRTTVRPNEDAPDHVKRLILDGEDAALDPRRATAQRRSTQRPSAPCHSAKRPSANVPPDHLRIPSAGTRP